MADEKSSMVKIKQYLSVPGQPVSLVEFKEFWDSLSDEEKEEFKATKLD